MYFFSLLYVFFSYVYIYIQSILFKNFMRILSILLQVLEKKERNFLFIYIA